MLDKACSDRPDIYESDVIPIKVRICAACDQTSFCITSDNKILCKTCCKYVKGWHAIGDTLSS